MTPLTERAAQFVPVATKLNPTTNVYHGIQVSDNYQWLEHGGSPEVREWSRQQNECSRAYFDQKPWREGIAQQLAQLRGEESARFGGLAERNGMIFATRFKPPAQQRVLIRLNSLMPPALWRTVFDPNAYNPSGSTAMDWYVPSVNGQLVAVCLSENGSEDGALHLFETESGRKLADVIPRVQYPTGGGSAAWNADGTGLYYTRYPHAGERPEADLNFYQQVWFHKLGTPVAEDTYEIGTEFPRIAEIELESSADGRWILAVVANGDGGDFAHHLRNPSGEWKTITRFEDAIKSARFGKDEALYLLSLKHAPHGKILRLSLREPVLAKATLVVPESKGVIREFAPSESGIYVNYLAGGPSELSWFPKGASTPHEISILPVSSVSGLQSWERDVLVFGNSSYVQPFAWCIYEPETAHPQRTALALTSPVNFDDIEVLREQAISKDGTRVPVNILKKKGVPLDGNNPTILYGYGGYGISMTPSFDSTRRLWFDAGGVYAVANLRGGGEFGEEWHKAGNLTLKQNVFDDFIGAAQHLIRSGYTSPAKLAVQGGSNGGLLMGAILTQAPELLRAVVAQVGIFDMLRVELDPNGQFNITEFGSVMDLKQFQALYAYSPYHRVRDAHPYPAVLLTTGENDGRVNPAQSRKMTARLQAATGAPHPILYRSSASAGHGIGTALKDRIAEQADVYSFLFDQLSIDGTRWVFP